MTLRESFGAVLLLALEVLVAADLILTVAVDQTLENVAVLGLIVLIRTILSFSLEVEIEGVLRGNGQWSPVRRPSPEPPSGPEAALGPTTPEPG